MQKLQHEKSVQKRAQDKVNFLLANHVFCGQCGSALCEISGTDTSGNPDYRYGCSNSGKGQCDLCDQSKDMIESVARYFFNHMLYGPDWESWVAKINIDKYKKMNGRRRANLDILKSKLNIVEHKQDNLLKDAGDRVFDEPTRLVMKELENQRHMLEEQIEEEEQLCDRMAVIISKFCNGIAGNFDDEAFRQSIFEYLIDKIYLYEDRMVIKFHLIDYIQKLSYVETLEKTESHKHLVEYIADFNEE